MSSNSKGLDTCHHHAPLPTLDSSAVAEHIKRLEGWTLDDSRLVKRYCFGDATAALAFVERVGAVAEARNHHPHVHWWKRDVRIELWTHKSNGLTVRDVEFAGCCDPLGEM